MTSSWQAGLLQWDGVFSAPVARSMLLELEARRAWQREASSFHALDLLTGVDAFAGSFGSELREVARRAHARAQQEWGLRLAREASVRVHRFGAGTGAALHSDAGEPGARLVSFLAGPDAGDGGALVFADPRTRCGRVIEPRHNCGILFPTESGLQHGVTEQREARRYSIVFAFPSLRA